MKTKIKPLKLIASIIFCHLAGIIGAFFTTPSINGWYDTIIKPEFNPPSWIFGPMWLTLYTIMGISLYLVLEKKAPKITLIVFGIHWVLNATWSIVFFGMHDISLAFINIIALIIMIIATMYYFSKTSKIATYLLIPYLLWVSFASFLNYNLLILN